MKHAAFLFGGILLFGASAGAQINSDNSLPPAPEASFASAPVTSPTLFAATATPSSSAFGGPGTPISSSAASGAKDAQQPTVYGVFQNYNWQAYVGYSFFRFYAAPKLTLNTNGLNLGIVYYPRGLWIGADGEFMGEFGSYGPYTAKFALGGGGARFRWSAPRGLEVWGHGIVGGAHFLPQTAYGGQSAFAYEAGGGVDINVHHQRWAVRAQADLVGTRFFSTYQYSPKIAFGVVYRY